MVAKGRTRQGNNEITDVLQGFKTWVANNQDRIARAEKRGTLPYFVRDNRARINKLPTGKIVQDSKQELENHTHVKAQTNEPNGSYMPNSLNTQEQKAWNENEYKIEIALNLKASNQMNFEEANHGKGNPHYKDKGGNINCQTCTIVHEMRRRVYDVETLPNNNNRFAKLCKQENFSWTQRFLNVDGSDVDYDFTFNWIKNNGGGLMDSKKLGEYIAKKINVDGRFEIYCGWKKGKAHVFCAERVNGVIKWFDPQNGLEDASSYFERINPRMVGIIRIDNKLINPKMMGMLRVK